MRVNKLLLVTKKSAIEVDILFSGKLHVKASTKLNKRRNSTLDLTSSLRRLKYARNDFEHGRLTRSVGAYQAKSLATLYLKRDVIKSLELLKSYLAACKGNKVLFQRVELLRGNVKDL